jgi:lipoprotein-releasing system permease protein
VPVKVEVKDLLYVSIISFIFALIAAVYPAIKASKTKPAEVLKGN